MTPLPVIRGTSTALYPFTQTYTCQTGKSDAENASTARWPKGLPLVTFDLSYPRVTQAQKNTLKAFLVSAKGQFTTNLSVTTDATYNNLSLDSDEFAAVEQISTNYGVRWRLKQTVAQSYSPGASGGAFPTLTSTRIGQLPYTQKKRFKTIVNTMDSGPKYTYGEYGTGLANFPTDGLMGWEFNEPSLSDTDTAAIVAHFLANWGDAFSFAFTDEDATTFNSVYYGSPQLVIQRQQKDQNAIHVVLIQTF